jgi:hypothetical protein
MRKFFATAALTGLVLVPASLSATAFAGNSGDGSEYGTQPGFAVAQINSDGCAGHGAFDAFGKDNSLAGGANGYQTGINNGTLCGNRQGNL